ncbi:MAG: sensor histidine kinase [Oscillospiraceae bacterium]
MEKLQRSTAAKFAAVFLFIVFIGTATAGTLCTAYVADDGFYNTGGLSFYDTSQCRSVTDRYAGSVYYDYLYYTKQDKLTVEEEYNLKKLQEQFKEGNTNFFFTVTDAEGNVVLSNYVEQDYGMQASRSFSDTEKIYDEEYIVNAWVKSPITAADDYYTPYRTFSTLYTMRYAVIAAAAASAVLAISLFIFLMVSAGRRKGREEIVLRAIDRLPLDLYAAGIIAVEIILLYIVSENCFYSFGFWEALLLCTLAALASLPALMLCTTFAVRVKAGRWWENTVIYRLMRFMLRLLRFIGRGLACLAANLPLLWKTVLAFAVFGFINLVTLVFFMDSGAEGLFFIFGLLFNLAVLSGLCFIMLQLNKLKRGAEKIAFGDYTYKIDTQNMFWDIKAHAGALNNIGLGMSKAVDERLKSERLKTELITNVSHDIKTPLTSIVSYVDLLKKENLENKNARAYIEVLDRQSARLKKLTEDLVEASKAATGNISVSPERTDITELLNQSVGEYSDRFAESELEAVIKTPQEAVILADGKLMWRVFDNLLNNICKYSLPKTRVYFDVAGSEGGVTVTLKNISRYPLSTTSDELVERFVRGDSSRMTEGSGLGLSIAKSLTELQKGSFSLSVDGDLFKVIIRFNRIR